MGCSNSTTVKAEPPVPKIIRDQTLIPKEVTLGSNHIYFADAKNESEMTKTGSEMMITQDH